MEATPTDIRTNTSIGIRPRPSAGSLHLGFALRGDRTVLSERFVSAPFGTVRLSRTDDGPAELQITNPAGGVLGGDRLDLRVRLGSGSSVSVLTQGATKLYRGERSEQDALLGVGEGAFLEYLPHHTIPYAGSSHVQRTTFEVASSATLIAWEAHAAGRLARGERFEFERISTRTELWCGGRPLVVDGMELGPKERPEPFGGFDYHAAMYVRAPVEMSSLATTLQSACADSSAGDLIASASAPEEDLCTVRILADRAPDLYRTLGVLRSLVRDHLGITPAYREVS